MGVNSKRLMRYLQYTIFIGVAFSLFVLVPGVPKGYITIATSALCTAIAALGFNVLLGYAGLISIGNAAFMGLGAYISGYVGYTLHWPILLALLVAVAVPLVVGLIVGLVALRLKDLYLAIATLGLGEIFRLVFAQADRFTGGYSGFAIKKPVTGTDLSYFAIFGHVVTKTEMYFIVLIILLLLTFAVYNLVSSSSGRAFVAMKNSESAARAMGVNLFKMKLLAFALSAAFAGLAGVLYAYSFGNIQPDQWGLGLSLDLIAIIVIGGSGTVGGAIVGTIVVKGLPELLKFVISAVPYLTQLKKDVPSFGKVLDGLPMVTYGVLVVVIILFYPRGLIYFLDRVAGFITKPFVKLYRLIVKPANGDKGVA